MTTGPERVQRCYWCPDPRHPSPSAHPDGSARHRPPPADPPAGADPEPATTCDRCGAAIPYGARCYLVPSGEKLADLPVITVECEGCQVDP